MQHKRQISAVEQIFGYNPFITMDQMLAEGSLRGLIVENEQLEKTIDLLAKIIEDASDTMESIAKYWELYTKAAGQNSDVGIGAWIEDMQSKIDESRNDILSLNKGEGFFDKIKSFFGFKTEEREIIERAAERVIVVKGAQKALNDINNRLIKMTKDRPVADEKKLDAFLKSEFKKMIKGLGAEVKKEEIMPILGDTENTSLVLSKIDRKTLDAGSNLLQTKLDIAQNVLSLAAPPPAPPKSTSSKPVSAEPAAAEPEAGKPEGEKPEAGKPEKEVEKPKVKRANLEKIIKSFVDKNGPIPSSDDPDYEAKVKGLLDRVRDSLGSKGIKMESLKNSSLEGKLIIERINRMAGLPSTEE